MAPTASLAETDSLEEQLNEATGSLRGLDAKSLWRTDAPASVRDAWRGGGDAAWLAWRAHLERRKPAVAASESRSLVWGLAPAEAERLSEWVDRLARAGDADTAGSLVERWLGASADEPTVLSALESIALAAAAPRLAAWLDEEEWWRLAESLRRLADEASAAPAAETDRPAAVVVEQLLGGELPLVLSRAFPEMRPIEQLGAAARETLSAGLERLTDGEGLLAAPLWIDPTTPAAVLLAACWTRCVAWSGEKNSGDRKAGDRKPFSRDARLQFEWLTRQSLRLADRDGRLAFAPDGLAGSDELLRAMLHAGGDPSDQSAAVERLRRFRGDDTFEPPAPSSHSEWAELGVLASGWRDKAPRIVVAHPDTTTQIEVSAGRSRLLAGDWPIDVVIDGKPAEPVDTWECQCWYSDDECDFLELVVELQGGGKLERQVFLAREDGVGFLADVLMSGRAKPAELKLVSRLPMGHGVSLRPEKQTRDAVLTVESEPVAGLVPLALAEWRDDPRGGELTAEGGALVLTREQTGVNVASHLWIDFSTKRFEKQRTWRRLTVAESLKNVSPDVAIAYRVQAAKQQWLVYRSLSSAGNRTVLGQNYSSEALVGRFNAADGTVDEYLEIEAAEEE